MNIALIPARGGSKRIPRKNVKIFRGYPMISWSIKAALESRAVDHIFVSTDDEEIASVAADFGATPFNRPSHLASDTADTLSVVRHAISHFNSQGLLVSSLCTIYATAPFVQSDDLNQALSLHSKDPSRLLFTATSFPFPIQRAFYLTEAGTSQMFHPTAFSKEAETFRMLIMMWSVLSCISTCMGKYLQLIPRLIAPPTP